MSLPAEISGKESPAGDGSALDALIDFYRSFNASDLNALAGNWADGEAPSNNDFHLFVGREKGYCETPAVRLELRIRTSRWFVKLCGVWRQLHHHGSIDEPALLADYQRAILGTPLGATS